MTTPKLFTKSGHQNSGRYQSSHSARRLFLSVLPVETYLLARGVSNIITVLPEAFGIRTRRETVFFWNETTFGRTHVTMFHWTMSLGGRVFSTNSLGILNEQMVMHWSQHDIGSMILIHCMFQMFQFALKHIKTTAYNMTMWKTMNSYVSFPRHFTFRTTRPVYTYLEDHPS